MRAAPPVISPLRHAPAVSASRAQPAPSAIAARASPSRNPVCRRIQAAVEGDPSLVPDPTLVGGVREAGDLPTEPVDLGLDADQLVGERRIPEVTRVHRDSLVDGSAKWAVRGLEHRFDHTGGV